jgi:pilus assembly protein Flp/PilA
MLLLRATALYVRARFGQLRADEGGVTAVEYALMVAIIALLMVAGSWLLFTNIQNRFNDTADCVANPGGANCPKPTTPP